MDPSTVEIFTTLAKESPWIALCAVLFWRDFRRENQVVSAFKDGAESTRQHGEATHRLLKEVIEELTRLRLRLEAGK